MSTIDSLISAALSAPPSQSLAQWTPSATVDATTEQVFQKTLAQAETGTEHLGRLSNNGTAPTATDFALRSVYRQLLTKLTNDTAEAQLEASQDDDE
jgi:hypothetical protein